MADWTKVNPPREQVLDPDIVAALRSSEVLMRETVLNGAAYVIVVTQRLNGELMAWVHWHAKPGTEWPPDHDEHVFGRAEASQRRVQSWLFPSVHMAADLVRQLWGLELAVPPLN